MKLSMCLLVALLYQCQYEVLADYSPLCEEDDPAIMERSIPVNHVAASMLSPCKNTLTSLFLKDCNITGIDDDAFNDVQHLKDFILLDNKLTVLNGSCFKNMNRLKLIDLRNNDIRRCDNIDDLLNLKSLKHIHVGGNPHLKDGCPKLFNRCTTCSESI